jgi:EAL domain-containing protein (putative c-di-GMP-specific phosphodiesterase class I)/ActR/RegA family two-component response regulator
MTGSLAELTVLIVDDNRFIVGLLRRYLKKLGIAAPLEAHDGASALDHVDSAVVDVVLCDLGMPGMDGIEFLRHLADREAPPDVILLSGQDRSILNTAVRLGRAHGLCVLGSVSKPFTLAPFKALLEQAGNGATGSSRGSLQPLTPEAIRAGLAADAVELVFQPKVSLRNRQMIGVEAFLRWRDVDGQLKSPAAVVPVAEQWGLINGLTEVVVRKAMTQSGIWRDEGHRFDMAINVSMHDLDRYDFPEFVVDAAESAGADLAAVILEITESQIMADIVKPLEVLSRLRLKGVGLAIDDYGTGASSMQQLKRVPFTELKIDREFVAGAPEDDAARAMLMSSISLGKDLGLTVVAEGVETESEWRLMASRGVDVVQGYFVARPMAAGEMEGWLGRWNSSAC